MANPLNTFVPSGGSGTSDLRVKELPKLTEMIKQLGFSEGIAQFDQQMEGWRADLERMLNERLQGKPVISTGKL